jgi:hypothetical protein
LGEGDIVPVTTGARLLVGLEALFGVVLAAAFVSSVFWAMREKGGAGDVYGSHEPVSTVDDAPPIDGK